MKELNNLVWLVLALSLAWAAYNKIGSDRAEECQAYDSLGHGIGCEGWDLTDL
jgi:hypothetical protein